MSDAAIVEFFLGYKWRRVPSVRLIPKRNIEVWKQLPSELRRITDSFHVDGQVPRVTAAYNKLKHGPQLIIQNPVDRVRQYGNTTDLTGQLAPYESLDKPSVRLLFAGARTQGQEKGHIGSVAPFLIDDEGAVNRIFFNSMVPQAILFSVLVKMQIALYQNKRINLDIPDEGILRIVEAQGHYLDNTAARNPS